MSIEIFVKLADFIVGIEGGINCACRLMDIELVFGKVSVGFYVFGKACMES